MKLHVPIWGWALLVVVGVAGVRLWMAPRPVEVEVARASRGVIEDAVTNSQAGTVRSRRRARVGPEVAGRIIEISVREGARVKRGQVLFRLDPVTARMQRDVAAREAEAAAAALESARAAADLARREFARVDELRARGVAAAEAWDQANSKRDAAEAEVRVAEARAARARADVRLAEDGLGHLEVTAPFDGVVTDRWVETGESVIPGQASFEVIDPEQIYVSAPIDEVDIGRVREGLPARVTLDPYPGEVWQGRVTRVSVSVDDTREQDRILEVEVSLEPRPGMPLPKPGTSADVEIVLAQRDRALRVPSFSVVEARRVYTVVQGRVVSREVTVGLRNWEWTEIQSGLAEGDPVIVNSDRLDLKPGLRVRLREGAEAPGAAIESGAGEP